ncbi:uncharacterized protein LOC130939285 [Arachis stenosperma]|uniref:uncharacterized protein LOC130939285 n=1 Tax=Arachis stenosperma TaxID=217475 RepID=UPI0025ABBAAB|nr:uncharacterized protein LOC130939285 [Arachis stenosperma]
MEVEDDWDLTAEELDSLERDAFQKIAQLRDSSTPPSSQQFNQHQHSTIFQTTFCQPFPTLPTKPHFGFPSSKVDALPQGKNEPSKELPKFSVKLFLHSSGHVAAKFQYDQGLCL